MTFIVDRDACIGCGECAERCSDIFAMDYDHKAFVKHTPIDQEEPCAISATDFCPTDAIYMQ